MGQATAKNLNQSNSDQGGNLQQGHSGEQVTLQDLMLRTEASGHGQFQVSDSMNQQVGESTESARSFTYRGEKTGLK